MHKYMLESTNLPIILPNQKKQPNMNLLTFNRLHAT